MKILLHNKIFLNKRSTKVKKCFGNFFFRDLWGSTFIPENVTDVATCFQIFSNRLLNFSNYDK